MFTAVAAAHLRVVRWEYLVLRSAVRSALRSVLRSALSGGDAPGYAPGYGRAIISGGIIAMVNAATSHHGSLCDVIAAACALEEPPQVYRLPVLEIWPIGVTNAGSQMETGAPVPIREMINEPDIWPPAATLTRPEWDMPGWGVTIWRGMRCICPRCGEAPIFDGYLKVHPQCRSCQAPLGDMPADDAPPYIAMFVVLHFLTFFVVMIFKFGWQPSDIDYGVMLTLLVVVCMAALRVAKGAVIGILLKLGLKRAVLN